MLVWFDHLAGVPVHYARDPVAPFGTRGKRRRCRLDAEFKAKLELCLKDLWGMFPDGKPDILVEGGCFVEKAGVHATGHAIDIDAFWWDLAPTIARGVWRSLVCGKTKLPSCMAGYVATSAVLRMHFGVVLDRWYNDAHVDHFHIDDSRSAASDARKSSRMIPVFVQAALRHVFGREEVDIDGDIGTVTREAMRNVIYTNGLLGVVTEESGGFDEGQLLDVRHPDVWGKFLQCVAHEGFKRMRGGSVRVDS